MQYYHVIIILTVLSMLVMLGQLETSDILEGSARRGFRITFILVIVTALSECAGVLMDHSPDILRIPHALVKAMELSLTPILIVTWVFILGGWKMLKPAVPFVFLHAVLEFASIGTGWVFYIDEVNVYTHGPIYPLYYVVLAAAIVYLFYAIYRFSMQYQTRNTFSLFLIAIFLLIGVSAHIIFSSIRVDWITAAMAFMMFYSFYMELTLKMDRLTGLMNRRSYERRLERIKDEETVIMFDVDNFKQVNDKFGHAIGDKALKFVADCILQIYGRRGMCYRIGGDEFCVILKKGQAEVPITAEEEAEIPEDYKLEGFQESTPALRHMNYRFDELIRKIRENTEYMPDVSLGYYRFDADVPSSEAVARADALMYANKKRRKERAAKMNQ